MIGFSIAGFSLRVSRHGVSLSCDGVWMVYASATTCVMLWGRRSKMTWWPWVSNEYRAAFRDWWDAEGRQAYLHEIAQARAREHGGE